MSVQRTTSVGDGGVFRKKQAVVLVGIVAMAVGVAVAEEIVDFSRDGHGWRAANHVANIRQTDTGYAFNVTDIDPWCVASSTYAMPSPPGMRERSTERSW